MEELNVVNDTQTPAVEVSIPAEEESGTEQVQTAEVTIRPQSMSDNSKFRKLRLENERLRSENEQFTSQEIERRMKEDLEEIRRIDPQIASLDEIGEDFADLIAAGIKAPLAFAAVREMQKASLPPNIGEVDENSRGEKDFYLPAEVDALSQKDLANPKIWERVRKSMTKW